MEERVFEVRLMGFVPHADDPAMGLVEAFDVSVERAVSILDAIPVVIKTGLDAESASLYARSLINVGAEVELIDLNRQVVVPLSVMGITEKKPSEGAPPPISLQKKAEPERRPQYRSAQPEEQAEVKEEPVPEEKETVIGRIEASRAGAEGAAAQSPGNSFSRPPMGQEGGPDTQGPEAQKKVTGKARARGATAGGGEKFSLSRRRTEKERSDRTGSTFWRLLVISLVGLAVVALSVDWWVKTSAVGGVLEADGERLLSGHEISSKFRELLPAGEEQGYLFNIPAGECRAWLAVNGEPGECDLDLYLYREQTRVQSDTGSSDTVMAYYCSQSGEQINLRVANNSNRTCVYGLGEFTRSGEDQGQLRDQLDLSLAYLNRGRPSPLLPMSEIGEQELQEGEPFDLNISMMAESCRTYVAVAEVGVTLSVGLWIEGAQVYRGSGTSNVAVSGTCAEEDQTGFLRMESSETGPVVWRTYRGSMGNRL